MSNAQTLFQDSRADVIRLVDLYDPDAEASTDAKTIATVGSVIIDTENNGILYYVTYVDPDTNKATYVPARIITTDSNDATASRIDYDNNRMMLFYDDRVEPTKLVVDSLMPLFGEALKDYRLKRTDPDTNEEQIISVYYDSDGNYQSNRIPLRTVAGTVGVKYPTNCHTNIELEDDELITMEVFDQSGTLSATVTLFARKASILNDGASSPIITNFDISGAQIKDGAFYLYEKQDVSALDLTPEVTYNTGEKKTIPVDGELCFLYGTDDLIASYPGLRQTIACKYYLRSDQESTIADDTGHGRFVYVEKDIVILANSITFGSKISVIPQWDSETSSYSLRFFLYTTDRDVVYDVTDLVTVSAYNGNDFDTTQMITVELDMQALLNLDEESTYAQNIWIRFKPYNYTVERYIIKDSENDIYAYGVDSTDFRRPVIHYDAALQKYFIPTSIFGNKEAWVESAYTRAHPLYDPVTEINEPTPTHFTARNALTGNTLITAPIPLEEYSQAWNAIISGSNAGNALVGKAIIIEFLVENAGEYQIIYGVPVDVYASDTGYQG